MKYEHESERPQRRTISLKRTSKTQLPFPYERISIIHADERSVWSRVFSQCGEKLLCTVEQIEQTAEVAFQEGWREIKTQNRLARAAYAIDWLYNGFYFVSVHLEYRTGDYSGCYMQEVFPIRDACVEYFLEHARRHFGCNRDMLDGQNEARRQMQQLLEPSLFGFIEPGPAL